MTKKEIIEKPVIGYKEIMVYCDCSKSKAYDIMFTCKKKYDGMSVFDKNKITTESLMKLLGTTREKEARILNSNIKEGSSNGWVFIKRSREDKNLCKR